MKEELEKWAEKVSGSKKKLDKSMFDELMKVVMDRLERRGYEDTVEYLKDNVINMSGSSMVGPRLVGKNSKMIKDKLWSLRRLS